MYDRDNFFQIYQIDVNMMVLDYNDESRYWIEKNKGQKQKKRLNISEAKYNHAAIKI